MTDANQYPYDAKLADSADLYISQSDTVSSEDRRQNMLNDAENKALMMQNPNLRDSYLDLIADKKNK